MSSLREIRSTCLELALHRFYSVPENAVQFISILTKDRSSVSRRLIDWLATNYSKSQQVNYEVGSENFNMFASYKSHLKGYSKRYFDPFQRKDRIQFELLGKEYTTTVGQLNFFKWAIQYKVIDYAKDNYNRINQNMIKTKENVTIGQRKLLSMHKGFTHTKANIVMEF